MENEENLEESPQAEPKEESPSAEEQGSDAGAGADNGYAMMMEQLQRIEQNQAQLENRLSALADAQAAIVDAGAVIHEEPDNGSGTDSVDEFVPIEELDLTL